MVLRVFIYLNIQIMFANAPMNIIWILIYRRIFLNCWRGMLSNDIIYAHILAFNHNSTSCMEVHLRDAVAARYDQRKGTAGLLQSCREFSGRGDNHAVQQRRRGRLNNKWHDRISGSRSLIKVKHVYQIRHKEHNRTWLIFNNMNNIINELKLNCFYNSTKGFNSIFMCECMFISKNFVPILKNEDLVSAFDNHIYSIF